MYNGQNMDTISMFVLFACVCSGTVVHSFPNIFQWTFGPSPQNVKWPATFNLGLVCSHIAYLLWFVQNTTHDSQYFFLWENVFFQATDFPRKMMEYIPFVSQVLSFCQGYYLNMNRLWGFYTNLTFPIPTLLSCLWSSVSKDSAPIFTILGCRDYQMQPYNFFKGKLFSYNVKNMLSAWKSTPYLRTCSAETGLA